MSVLYIWYLLLHLAILSAWRKRGDPRKYPGARVEPRNGMSLKIQNKINAFKIIIILFIYLFRMIESHVPGKTIRPQMW
jgi:hypothetical protein